MSYETTAVTGKRGQLEIIGLILLVVILAIGLLIYIRLSNAKSAIPERSYLESQFGPAFISALVRTEVTDQRCGGARHELGILFRALAENDFSLCGSREAYISIIEQKVRAQILAGSLDTWGYSYRFRLVSGGNDLFSYTNPDAPCDDTMDKAPAGTQLIPLDNGKAADLLLEICI